MVDKHGKENATALLSIFENYLDSPAFNSQQHDRIRESVVILLGATAKHLEPSDPRIPTIVDKLLETLRTPSEPVQIAVAECLPPLVKVLKVQAPDIINEMLDLTLHGATYGLRRGGAYGLAGAVKGRGISALKECAVMDKLKAAVEDKKEPEGREGALFAFETMSRLLGRLFEPYILQILPLLLISFADSVTAVREATAETSRVIMSNLSAHCIKLLLPAVLKGLEEYKWRSKAASVELLGYMAYCAPKQLAVSLPTIIPRLSEVLNDSHVNVQASGKAALTKFSDILQNPEIKQLAPVLMKALSDPTTGTQPALAALMQTSFAHYIDGPSLALVIPIIERGLKERGTDIKKKAAHTMGSLASLTEPKDLVPYMSVLIPLVREVLVDPVPEARAVAAKALGGMVERLGEVNFPTLVGELLHTLKSEGSGVDRQGAAQGLSEVLTGIGLSRLEELLPEILANIGSTRPFVREGFMLLLIYLPATFGDSFQPYLSRVIPHVLRGLADEFEYVREAALKAAQIIITRFANSAVDLLLPELEKGLFDDNWRIRQSSVQLLGDLLFKVAGVGEQTQVSEVVDGELDAATSGAHEANRKVLVELLGIDRYYMVLASVYILRSDTNAIVRQAAVQVWKSIVHNTPRTLKEILPYVKSQVIFHCVDIPFNLLISPPSGMMSIVVTSLASTAYEKRQVAAATLGDLVSKLGDYMLNEIIPILREQLNSSDFHTRQGVCIGMTQILQSTGKNHIEHFEDEIMDVVKVALMDEESEVRAAAAQAFDILHELIGPAAIDEILPPLLAQLKDAKGSAALDALTEIMAVRGNVVFPLLLPTLLTRPITDFNAKALGSLVLVAGPAVNRRLGSLLAPLMDELTEGGVVGKEEIKNTIRILVGSIDSVDGLHSLMMLLFELMKPDVSVAKRCAALAVFESFCASSSKVPMVNYLGDWVKTTVSLLDESVAAGSKELVSSAWKAFDALVKNTKKDEYENVVGVTRRAVQSLVADARVRRGSSEDASFSLSGLDLPKVGEGRSVMKLMTPNLAFATDATSKQGPAPFLTMYLHCLMFGSSETREQAALGLGSIIQFTSADKLKPFVMQVTGPLIRIVGEKFSWQIKATLLDNMG